MAEVEQVAALLIDIEAQLRQLELWQAEYFRGLSLPSGALERSLLAVDRLLSEI